MTDWTVDTLKEHVDQRFIDNEKAVNAALAAAKEAVNKAEAAQSDKNRMQNEFRGQLSDQATTFMPRKEAEATDQIMANDVAELKAWRREVEGRSAGLTQGWAILVGATLIAGTIIGAVVAVH